MRVSGMHTTQSERLQTLPKTRPDLPRSSSSESGFFFCGIMLEPVLYHTINGAHASCGIEHAPVRVAKRHETELSRRVNDEILRHSAHMRRRETRPHHEFDDKVAVADAVQRILRDGRKAEVAREELTVDGKWVARERARAKWQDRDARHELLQALEVRAERKRVREQQVRPPDRLPALWVRAESEDANATRRAAHLQVRVAGHEVVALPVSALNHDADERAQACLNLLDFVHEPEPHVGRDLVVARAARVQLAAEWADDLAQAPLVRGVDVFVVRLRFELGESHVQ
jgi:hypothetical protein